MITRRIVRHVLRLMLGIGILLAVWGRICLEITWQLSWERRFEFAEAVDCFLAVYVGGLAIILIVGATDWIKHESVKAMVQFAGICLTLAAWFFHAYP